MGVKYVYVSWVNNSRGAAVSVIAHHGEKKFFF